MIYYGTNYANDLRHWKYIRKYKNSNGNWTYVYDESKSRYGSYQKTNRDAHENIVKAERELKAPATSKNSADAIKKYINEQVKVQNDAFVKQGQYKKNNRKEYQIDKFMYNNGSKIVDALNTTSSSISKAKTFVKDLLTKKKG